MFKLIALLTTFLVSACASANPFPSNTLTWGDGLSTVNKRLKANRAGTPEPEIRYNVGSSQWQFSNDGSTFTAFGVPTVTKYAWSGNHSDNCYITTTSSSFVNPTGDASCTFNEIYNSNMGTVSSVLDSGNNTSGITFTAPVTGIYRVCASGFIRNSGGGVAYARLYDGTTVLASAGQNTAGAFVPASFCGIKSYTASASVSIVYQLKTSGSGTTEVGNTVTGSGTTVDWTVDVVN